MLCLHCVKQYLTLFGFKSPDSGAMITHWILKVTDGQEGLGCGSLPELRTEESLKSSAKLQHSGRTDGRADVHQSTASRLNRRLAAVLRVV